ncbi:MAG: hypothetical protein Wins2KO_08080 [Winogradskyella sp.]|nr:hypothetical protein [Winogradskyella sp.]
MEKQEQFIFTSIHIYENIWLEAIQDADNTFFLYHEKDNETMYTA